MRNANRWILALSVAAALAILFTAADLLQRSVATEVESNLTKSESEVLRGSEPPPMPAHPTSRGPALAATKRAVEPDQLPAAKPSTPLVPPDGASAGLTGRITQSGKGVAAQIEFVAGPNRGHNLVTESDGSFQADSLYPGFGMIRINDWITREVELLHRRTRTFELDLGFFGEVSGQVIDEQDRPLGGVEVSLDGTATTCDRTGTFRLTRRASGDPLLLIQKPGYVPHRERLPLSNPQLAAHYPPDSLKIVLQKGCTLRLEAGALPGAGEDMLVYLFPTKGQPLSTARLPQPTYPWHLLNPVRLQPGTTRLLQDLPAVKLEAFAHHRRGKSKPAFAWLTPDQTGTLRLEMEPVPTLEGKVTQNGKPLSNVHIELSFENPIRATHIALGQASSFYRAQPIEIVPAAHQTTQTSRNGSFLLGDWSRIPGQRFLTVSSAEGVLQYCQPFSRASTGEIHVEL